MATAQDALHAFYAHENLPADGGVGDWLVWVSAFGVSVPLPNVSARAKLVPYHDLHHVITGYGTDEAGEAEAGAWCLGTGGGPLMGTMYDLGAFGLGLVRFPRRTVRAFYRGRQCKNLYRRPVEHWLSRSIGALTEETRTGRQLEEVTGTDRVALALHVALAAVWCLGHVGLAAGLLVLVVRAIV